mmetsp:Transcript_28794/g.41235  ORF Transcript_28794/g.41235 Transcript_28794/m.41235 type:complete len:310 (-) Transcript_28794:150-1079(-)
MKIFFGLAVAALVGFSNGFTLSKQGIRNGSFVSSNFRRQHGYESTSKTTTQLEMKYTVVLVRHGESTWNEQNRFTGWADVPLSAKGIEEAKSGGQLLKESGLSFDVAYTSTLSRAIKTLWIILEEMDLMYLPIINTWRLNERHYGALQGLNKQETVEKHGKDQVLVWRRSYDIPPPALDESSEYYPGNDPRYKDVPKELLPFTESLKLTEERFMVDWEEKFVPAIKRGERLLVVAHGNTIRALVKHLDDISADEICELNIPTGVPLIYELDENMKPIRQKGAIPPLSGRYLGDLEEIKNRILGVAMQTK